MYLKKIIAHGFKSFADKIIIDFDSNITGIVGPNGSGKSNVVDAVRWVLGEQSVKSLRGDSSMTDVIFSGSKSRKESNVASVTLVFDNTDKYLPLLFNEVEIKRRVYKDGTNEYFINNERCRLKDITELLMDSGIAKESFNIIGQGKIEEIIASKPVDRRVIFEEAAGVLKYKKRKEEAIRKIERTDNNLVRINDIVNEIETSLEPLKIQKESALKYESLTEELKNIEVALIIDDISNLNNKYQDYKERVTRLNDELATLSLTTSDFDVKELSYQNEINKLNDLINKTQKELIEVSSQTEKLNSQKLIILERKKYEVEDIKVHDNIIYLTEKLNEINISLNNSINKQKLIKEEIEELENIIKTDTSNLNNVRDSKRKNDLILTSLVNEKNKCNNKINNLENIISSSLNIPDSVTKVINNPKIKGVESTVGNLIEIDSKYSVAISTSLGASTNYLVVKDELVAKEAIRYLKNNNLGRVTFYPLNIIKGRFIAENTITILKKQAGFIDTANNLVKYDVKYKNIINNLLGNIIVVNNIDDANYIASLINYRYKVVSKEGDIVNVGGSITGGVNKIRNSITDKHDLELLKHELINYDNKINDIESIINKLDNDLLSYEDKVYVKNKDLIEKNAINAFLTKEIDSLNVNINNTKNTLDGAKTISNNTISDEENKVISDYFVSLNKKEEVTNNLNNLIIKRDDYNNLLETSIYNRKKESSIYNTKLEELKTSEIELNRCDVKLDNLLNNLNETYQLTYEYAKTLYILEIDSVVARNKISKLKSDIKSLGVVNIGSIEEFDRINERYLFLMNQREDLLSAKETLFKIIEEMDKVVVNEFKKTFDIINVNFKETFKDLFKGGNASLKLTDPSNLLETGIEIIASPPGKKLTSINLLSGGEKTFTAISLLFAILKSRNVPFAILDEVEAALDEVNVESFGSYLTSLKAKTQFILITHKKKTMEFVNSLYGITMQESGVSKLVSVKLEEIK